MQQDLTGNKSFDCRKFAGTDPGRPGCGMRAVRQVWARAAASLRGGVTMKRETVAVPNRYHVSRRSFVRIASAASAAALVRITTEADLAFAQRRITRDIPADAILINANENPLGPCTQACSAMADLGVKGGRYEYGMTQDLVKTFATMEGLKPDYVRAY